MHKPWRVQTVSEAVAWCMRDFEQMFATVPCRKRDVLAIYVFLKYNVIPNGPNRERPAVLDPVTGRPDRQLVDIVTQVQNVYNRWFPSIMGTFDRKEAETELQMGLSDGYSEEKRAYDATYAFMSNRASSWKHDPFKCMPARLALWVCVRVMREYLLRKGLVNAASECDDVSAALLQQLTVHPRSLSWLQRAYQNRERSLQRYAAANESGDPDMKVLAGMAAILSSDVRQRLSVMFAQPQSTA